MDGEVRHKCGALSMKTKENAWKLDVCCYFIGCSNCIHFDSTRYYEKSDAMAHQVLDRQLQKEDRRLVDILIGG